MPKNRSSQITSAAESFEQISRSLRVCAEPAWMELDLTMAQLKTLFTLEYGGSMTIGQTGEKLGISLPTASHLVDRLVQGGFVERAEDPADRRRTLASTTAQGSELVKRLRQGGRDILVDWLKQLDDESLASLVGGLGDLARVTQESPVLDLVGTKQAR
ncbi:MAG TPA: MarR family transcriptional regulator [Nitrolancea sp.]|jgi:DNA-binding MarR family transcriptional regulator|nr:MarR family transcriptional regulator [Nitrolancea sp.]